MQGPNPISSDNYIAKTITLTKALKDEFPDMMIFGPVHYGFEGIYNWQGELAATPDGTNGFPDKYLAAIKTASDTMESRLSTSMTFIGTRKRPTARPASPT